MAEHIHDRFFKSVMADKQNAIDFFRTFLPDHIKILLDLATLTNLNQSFIDKELAESLSDVVFKCQMIDSEVETYVIILVEHKSYKDPFVAIQLLAYITNAYQQQIKNNKTLIPVIPLLFYHGKTKWKVKSLSELFDKLPQELKPYIPAFDLLFVDLSSTPEEQLMEIRNAFLMSAMITQKHARNPEELVRKLTQIFRHFATGSTNTAWETLTFYYFKLVEMEPKEFVHLLESVQDNSQINMKSLYHKILEEGRQEGRQEGISIGIEKGVEKGIEKGIHKTKRETILKGHKNGISVNILSNITDLKEAEVRKIIEESEKK